MKLKNRRKKPNRKKGRIEAKQRVDRVSEKARRGRPRFIRKSEVLNRTYDYGLTFEQSWDSVKDALLLAETEGDFKKSLEKAFPHVQEKFPSRLIPIILKIRHDLKFPKTENAQKKFFAESLGGNGLVSPRRSRDICAEVRKNPIHTIIRRNPYIECTCGYEGPAKYGRCRKCGTSRTAPQVPSFFDPDNY